MWSRFDTRIGKVLGWIGPRLFPRFHFERVYASKADPWAVGSSRYERDKYARTLDALGAIRFERALEIGCGEGIFTEQLAPRVAEVLGVDFSETAITRARARCHAMPNASFQVLDVTREPLPRGYDLILAAETLYFLRGGRGYHAVCRGLSASLVVGGTLLLVNPARDARSLCAPFLRSPGIERIAEHSYFDGRPYTITSLTNR